VTTDTRLARVRTAAERVAGSCGLDIFDIQLRRESSGWVLRVVIHPPPQRGAVLTARRNLDHRPRQRGQSKYGMFDRLWVGIVDMFGVMWLARRYWPGLAAREE